MNFTKHIGRHSNQKAIILYRKVPLEERDGLKTFENHMCYILYSEKLPRVYHDAIMKLLESREGQEAKEFSDILFRNLLPDGRNILQTLFQENHVRKVQTIQVITTPTPSNALRLDKLNEMLDDIDKGKSQELALLDNAQGMGRNAYPQQNVPANKPPAEFQTPTENVVGNALSDNDIANNLIRQSKQMETQAQGLLAEAARLQLEASQLTTPATIVSSVPKATSTTRKTSSAKKTTVTASAKNAGKPKKTSKAVK